MLVVKFEYLGNCVPHVRNQLEGGLPSFGFLNVLGLIFCFSSMLTPCNQNLLAPGNQKFVRAVCLHTVGFESIHCPLCIHV